MYVGTINDGYSEEGAQFFQSFTGSGRVYGYKPRNERLETNSWGFRDREFDITKNEGENRIIMLGDPIMAATEIKRDVIVPSFLESSLAQTAESDYTVYNLG